ncbi:MAG: hypothetical protein WDA71_09540 [Actinomycetota bacterium]
MNPMLSEMAAFERREQMVQEAACFRYFLVARRIRRSIQTKSG